MNIKLIKQILHKARRRMEKYARDNTSYSDTSKLNCLCGISTYMLFVCFKEMGYKPTFCMNDDHCFLQMNGYWVDLTLKQFNDKCPKIYFKRFPYRKNDGYGNVHSPKQRTKRTKTVRRWFREWPVEQNPFRQRGLPILIIPK